MTTTRLSSKGQVIIPKPIRAAHHWDTGQELAVIDIGDGIVLKPVSPFRETSLKRVGGCLKYPVEKGVRNLFAIYSTEQIWRIWSAGILPAVTEMQAWLAKAGDSYGRSEKLCPFYIKTIQN